MKSSKFAVAAEKFRNLFKKQLISEPEEDKDEDEGLDNNYWGVAKKILTIPEEGIDGLTKQEAIEALVKRYGHYEKLSVYHRLNWQMRYGDTLDVLKNFILNKIKIHEYYANAPINKQIHKK